MLLFSQQGHLVSGAMSPICTYSGLFENPQQPGLVISHFLSFNTLKLVAAPEPLNMGYLLALSLLGFPMTGFHLGLTVTSPKRSLPTPRLQDPPASSI